MGRDHQAFGRSACLRFCRPVLLETVPSTTSCIKIADLTAARSASCVLAMADSVVTLIELCGNFERLISGFVVARKLVSLTLSLEAISRASKFITH